MQHLVKISKNEVGTFAAPGTPVLVQHLVKTLKNIFDFEIVFLHHSNNIPHKSGFFQNTIKQHQFNLRPPKETKINLAKDQISQASPSRFQEVPTFQKLHVRVASKGFEEILRLQEGSMHEFQAKVSLLKVPPQGF